MNEEYEDLCYSCAKDLHLGNLQEDIQHETEPYVGTCPRCKKKGIYIFNVREFE